MIIVRISGGLGNQMFQYALIEAMKERYPDTEIKADVFDYDRVHAHTGYSLENYFTVTLPLANEQEVNKISLIPLECARPTMYAGLKKQIALLKYRVAVKRRSNLAKYNISDYVFNVFNPEVFNLDSSFDWYLNGYWQNVRYFKHMENAMSEIFQFRRALPDQETMMTAQMKCEESVSVHVRRGDYVNSGFDLCSKQYYLAAKEEIEKTVRNPVYYFFSDDADYVETNFPEFAGKIIVRHTAEDCDYDLQMMAACRHGINANSSFSFWGSALKQKNGLIISPQYTMERDHKLYETPILDNWVVVKNL